MQNLLTNNSDYTACYHIVNFRSIINPIDTSSDCNTINLNCIPSYINFLIEQMLKEFD